MMKKLLAVLALLLTTQPFLAAAHPGPEHQIDELTRSIRIVPDDVGLYIQRGSAYSDNGQLNLALADLQKAESLGEPVIVAFHQGILHHRMGKLTEARGYLDRFLERFPQHAPSLEARARVLRDAGDYEAALADFNAYFAKQKQPNPGDYISAANMIKQIKGKGIGAALAMLDVGMERLGVIPQLQQHAIELELERNDLSGAIERQASLEPTLGVSPDWKVAMGELLLRADRPKEADRLFEAATVQLATLRSTTARQRVLSKLQALYPPARKPD